MLVVLIVSIVFLGASTGQLERPGPCPKVKGVNYDLNRIVGLWYEYAATPDRYNGTLKCITNEWFPPENGQSSFISRAISKKTDHTLLIESECSVNTMDNLIMTRSHVPLLGEQMDHFWDFELVYDSHAISWACLEKGNNHVQSSIIFTRKPYANMDLIERAHRIFAQKGLSVSKFQKYDNNYCYYW